MQTNKIPQSLDLEAAAKELGYRPETLRKKARMGAIAHYRIGKKYRFGLEHLARYMRERERPASEAVE